MPGKGAEPTYLVTPEQAGLDILYALMMADGRGTDGEYEHIRNYLRTEFAGQGALFNDRHSLYSESNFTREYAYLKTLKTDELQSRFRRAVRYFHDWMKDHPEGEKIRKNLLTFALDIICDDGSYTDGERACFEIMEKEWGVNIRSGLTCRMKDA